MELVIHAGFEPTLPRFFSPSQQQLQPFYNIL